MSSFLCLRTRLPSRVTSLVNADVTIQMWIFFRVLKLSCFIRGKCYKTFYGRNLRMILICKSDCPLQAFPASSNVVGKAESLPKSGDPGSCFTQVGFGLTQEHSTRLARLARYKQPSLLGTFMNYGRKKFYKTEPTRAHHIKLFSVVVYIFS